MSANSLHRAQLPAPIQLELPSMPPCVVREAALPRHKRVRPPVHLMLDIAATNGTRFPAAPVVAPTLYAQDESGFRLATEGEIFVNTHELLKRRFRAGTPITSYPELLRSFLQAKVGCQRVCVFVALFVTRNEELIQVAELFRGTSGNVNIYPREVVRAAIACEAEGMICVRTDPRGKAEPTEHDINTARWLRRLFDVMETPLVDYIVVGDRMTSLRKRGCFLNSG